MPPDGTLPWLGRCCRCRRHTCTPAAIMTGSISKGTSTHAHARRKDEVWWVSSWTGALGRSGGGMQASDGERCPDTTDLAPNSQATQLLLTGITSMSLSLTTAVKM